MLSKKNLICTNDFSMNEIVDIFNLALKMKNNRFHPYWRTLLESKTFIMLFYNYSLRTRISFETAMTELGGHAQFITPSNMRLKTKSEAGEAIKDAAKVMSRYAAGLGIRIAESAISYYGEGLSLLDEYAKWSDIPVINMANDCYHPCQGLADILGWAEKFGGHTKTFNVDSLKIKIFINMGQKLYDENLVKRAETLLLASRFGMNITIARPDGYDLDSAVYKTVKENCQHTNTTFDITNEPYNCYKDQHVIYSRNWMSPQAYNTLELLKSQETQKAMQHLEWITTPEKMQLSDNAIFTHCMPIDRGSEVTDEVVDSDNSVVYDVAENRLHVQKAILALLLNKKFTLSQCEFLGTDT